MSMMKQDPVRLISRSSPLAQRQTALVEDQLRVHGVATECAWHTTQADKTLDVAVSTLGGRGAFTRGIDEEVLCERADLAVHSMKDMEPSLPEGLKIFAVLPREVAYDVFVGARGLHWSSVPKEGVIGTSSPRRAAQIKHARTDVRVALCRGNIQRRMERLVQGKEWDGIVLAGAGLRRLNWDQDCYHVLSMDTFLPAAGQGIVAIVGRKDDRENERRVQQINHDETSQAARIEHALIAGLSGNCETAVAVHAVVKSENDARYRAYFYVGGDRLEAEKNGTVLACEAHAFETGQRWANIA